MTIDLLGVLLFENEDDLNGNEVVGIVVVRKNESWSRVDRELGCVLAKKQAKRKERKSQLLERGEGEIQITSEIGGRVVKREMLTSKICATVSLPSTSLFMIPS